MRLRRRKSFGLNLEQESRPAGGAAFEVNRRDRAALEGAAYEHLVGRGHLDRLARLDDLNLLALIRHDAGQLFELPKAETPLKLVLVGSQLPG